MKTGKSFAVRVDEDAEHVGRAETPLTVGSPRVRDSREIIPLVVHLHELAANRLSQSMPEPDRVPTRAGKNPLGERDVLRPELADHVEVALKPARREHDGVGVQFFLCALAEVPHLDAGNTPVFLKQLCGLSVPDKPDRLLRQAGFVNRSHQRDASPGRLVKPVDRISRRGEHTLKPHAQIEQPLIDLSS